MKALPDIIGVISIGVALAVAAYFTPERALNRGLYIFIFAALAVIAIYQWHRDDAPASSRGWAATLGTYVLATLIIAVIGAAFGYAKGTSGSALDVIENTGVYFLLITICPALILIAFGGFVRAVMTERTMTANNALEADREA